MQLVREIFSKAEGEAAFTDGLGAYDFIGKLLNATNLTILLLNFNYFNISDIICQVQIGHCHNTWPRFCTARLLLF